MAPSRQPSARSYQVIALRSEKTVRYRLPYEHHPSGTAEKRVAVSAGEMLAILSHAAQTNRYWLDDFAGETVQISPDLYQVLLAYQQQIPRRAA